MYRNIAKTVIAIALSAVMIATAHAAPVLYGVTNGVGTGGGGGGAGGTGPGQESQLVIIDQTTGALTNVGTGIGFRGISAIDFHPGTGVLYATGRRSNEGPTGFSGTNVLLTIDKTTGIGTEVGATGIEVTPIDGFAVSGMSFRNGDNTLFGFTGTIQRVVTIDISSGAASLTGVSGIGGFTQGNGIAFNQADTLYHANQNALHTLDQTFGVATVSVALDYTSPHFNLVDLPGPRGPRVGAMDFRPGDGVLFTSVIIRGPVETPPAEGFVATLDINAGTFNYLSGGGSGAKLDAIAFMADSAPPVTTVPEPGTLALFGVGLAGLGFMRRRRVS